MSKVSFINGAFITLFIFLSKVQRKNWLVIFSLSFPFFIECVPENIYFYDIDVRNELMIYGLGIESETSMSIFYGLNAMASST